MKNLNFFPTMNQFIQSVKTTCIDLKLKNAYLKGFSLLLCLVFLFSFKQEDKKTGNDVKDFEKVQAFVDEVILEPIRKKRHFDFTGKAAVMSFSRCPTMYYSDIKSKKEFVKTDSFVNGVILFSSGCRSNYVCDFKVCVDSRFAVVKSKFDKDYLSVENWLAKTNPKKKTMN